MPPKRTTTPKSTDSAASATDIECKDDANKELIYSLERKINELEEKFT